MSGPTQQLLPGHEPSERDLVEIAMAEPLADKVQKAIEMLRLYEPLALRLDALGIRVAFSGGKDSIVIAKLAEMAGVQHRLVHNLTTLDPPELIRFMREHYPHAEYRSKAMPLLARMVERTNGPPTRLARWCCEEYKECCNGSADCAVVGVRVAESARRARLWSPFRRLKNKGAIVAPIVYWTDEDVWGFIRGNDMPYCSLYDEGFSRLGCVGCPLAGPERQRIEFDRWPKYEWMWKTAFRKFWDAHHGTLTKRGHARWFERFGTWEAMWDWWVSGGDEPDEERNCLFDEMMEGLA